MPLSAQRVVLGALWLAFVAYAFFLAPAPNPADPLALAEIQAFIAGKADPSLLALFNVMGLLPVLYLFLLIPDGHGQKVPAWPFGVSMFAVGAFALVPYLILRRPHADWPQPKRPGPAVRLFDSRWAALAGALLTAGVLGYGLWAGDGAVFAERWSRSRFVQTMSLDFGLCCVLYAALLGDDMRRRKIEDPRWFWAASLVPLLGPIVYLVVRPPLDKG
jgi:hypothetical protein